MLGDPGDHHKSKNKRRAAWERFRKMQNERRAAREHVFCPHGPDWCPQKGPPKTPQTIYFNMVLKFLGAPSEHPSWAHQKMEQPKWAPKSSLGDRAKHLFSNLFLYFLFFLLLILIKYNTQFVCIAITTTYYYCIHHKTRYTEHIEQTPLRMVGSSSSTSWWRGSQSSYYYM